MEQQALLCQQAEQADWLGHRSHELPSAVIP